MYISTSTCKYVNLNTYTYVYIYTQYPLSQILLPQKNHRVSMVKEIAAWKNGGKRFAFRSWNFKI